MNTALARQPIAVVGGPLNRTAASLRIKGDALDPVEVTTLLCCQPKFSVKKGDRYGNLARPIVARTGIWILEATDRSPGDLNSQIREILLQVTDDAWVWQSLGSRYRGDVFCGLFMAKGNEGLGLEPDVARMLAERGLKLSLDIYGSSDDADRIGQE